MVGGYKPRTIIEIREISKDREKKKKQRNKIPFSKWRHLRVSSLMFN